MEVFVFKVNLYLTTQKSVFLRFPHQLLITLVKCIFFIYLATVKSTHRKGVVHQLTWNSFTYFQCESLFLIISFSPNQVYITYSTPTAKLSFYLHLTIRKELLSQIPLLIPLPHQMKIIFMHYLSLCSVIGFNNYSFFNT